MNFASAIANIFMVVGTGGVGLAVVNQIFARRKSNAEAESIEADTAAKLLRGITNELERVQAKQITLEKRVDECDEARESSERRARAAERRAHAAHIETTELTSHLATLQKAYTITRRRVEYLTEVVREAGIPVSNWSTPPDGIGAKEKA